MSTCTVPAGTLSIPANSTSLGMKGGSHVNFYVPPGSGKVEFAFAITVPLPGVHWWLTNGTGSVLAQGTPADLASGTWSLGQDDPHTVWFTTDYNVLGIYFGQTVAYQLTGACTTKQDPAPTCSSANCQPPCACGGKSTTGAMCTCPTTPPASSGSSEILPVVLVGGALIGGIWLYSRHATPAGQRSGQARRRDHRRVTRRR